MRILKAIAIATLITMAAYQSFTYAQAPEKEEFNWDPYIKEFEAIERGECHTKLYFRKLFDT